MSTIGAAVAVLLLSLVILFRLGARSSVLAMVSLYFVYFCFGPVVLFYLGSPIYEGTVPAQIPSSALGFALGLLGFAVADLFLGRTPQAVTSVALSGPKVFSWTYYTALVVGAAYGVFGALRVVSTGALGDKLQAVAVAGSYHYQFVLIMTLLMCWSSVGWTASSRGRSIIVLAWASYFLYSMATAERDFIFVVFALSIHHFARKHTRRSGVALVLLAVLGVIGGSFVFAWRAGDDLTLETVLNQGSTLFVDSYLRMLTTGGGTGIDNTYVALINGQPATAFGSLTDWFVVAYTGVTDSGAGYGFSLSGEAFMNGGDLGIFLAFTTFGAIQLLVFRAGLRSPTFFALSVGFCVLLLYAVRGQAATLWSGCIWLGLVWMMIRIGGVPRRPPIPESSLTESHIAGS